LVARPTHHVRHKRDEWGTEFVAIAHSYSKGNWPGL
jgi:hypothetical protein